MKCGFHFLLFILRGPCLHAYLPTLWEFTGSLSPDANGGQCMSSRYIRDTYHMCDRLC